MAIAALSLKQSVQNAVGQIPLARSSVTSAAMILPSPPTSHHFSPNSSSRGKLDKIRRYLPGGLTEKIQAQNGMGYKEGGIK
ncbi:MAG: hypothetical protein V3S51_02530 [Dehalococcoidia bacterium]